MRVSSRRSRTLSTLSRSRQSLAIAVAMAACGVADQTLAQTHELSDPGGSVRIEAEDFSAKSVSPQVESHYDGVSGGANVGYFWYDDFLDYDVNVNHLLNYRLELRVASPSGTTIEVSLVDDGVETKLTEIYVSSADGWGDYGPTIQRNITLPSGTQTLRFKNKGSGANLDYITVRAGAPFDVSNSQPAPNAGPDINPLKGFSSGWWRADDYFASVGFQYIEWGKFEPTNGVFDWDYVENEVLSRAGSKDRHLILQFVVDWDDWGKDAPDEMGSHYKGPSWLKDLMGDEFENRAIVEHNDLVRETRATNYNHPVFIAEVTEAITKLQERFNEDERGFVIQVGALGFWGEWHNYPMDEEWGPSEEAKASVLSNYMQNLGDDGFTQVRYPNDAVNLAFAGKGMGYMNGSITPTPHGIEFGLELDTDAELWRNGPVGGEWPPGIWDVARWSEFFVDSIGMEMIETARYSTILAPEIDSDNPHAQDIALMLGDSFDETGQFMNMHRAMGYNFQVSDVRYLEARDQSGLTHLEVDLGNVGVAPFYKKWATQLALIDAETGIAVDLIDLDVDVTAIGPGDAMRLAASSSAELEQGKTYQIGLRILQPQADEDKETPWKLNARYTFVALANDVEVTAESWDANNALQGGWNILNEFQAR